MKQKTFLPGIEALRAIQEYVSSHLPRNFQNPDAVARIELILEEVVINIVHYAFVDEDNGSITVSIEEKNGNFQVEIRDNGAPFNPLLSEDPDLEAPIEERQEGGLGIFFVRSLCRGVTYEREAGNNVLRLIL